MFETASRPALAERQPMPRDAAPRSSAPTDAPAADRPEGRAAAPADAPALPGAGLAGLLERARTVQARLGGQPLPIANRDMLLITKLLGG